MTAAHKATNTVIAGHDPGRAKASRGATDVLPHDATNRITAGNVGIRKFDVADDPCAAKNAEETNTFFVRPVNEQLPYLVAPTIESAHKWRIVISDWLPALSLTCCWPSKLLVAHRGVVEVAHQNVMTIQVVSDGVQITPIPYPADLYRLSPVEERIGLTVDYVPNGAVIGVAVGNRGNVPWLVKPFGGCLCEGSNAGHLVGCLSSAAGTVSHAGGLRIPEGVVDSAFPVNSYQSAGVYVAQHIAYRVGVADRAQIGSHQPPDMRVAQHTASRIGVAQTALIEARQTTYHVLTDHLAC